MRIPKDFPIKPLKPGDAARDKATCGTCGRSWDDAIITGSTPAPSARCPFEYFHEETVEHWSSPNGCHPDCPACTAEREPSTPYRILRFFSDGRSPKRIKVVSSLEIAKLHCNSPLTKGVLRSGVKWFDGYREIKRKGR